MALKCDFKPFSIESLDSFCCDIASIRTSVYVVIGRRGCNFVQWAMHRNATRRKHDGTMWSLGKERKAERKGMMSTIKGTRRSHRAVGLRRRFAVTARERASLV